MSKSQDLIARRHVQWLNMECLSFSPFCSGVPSAAFCQGCLRHCAAVYPVAKAEWSHGASRQDGWVTAWKSANPEDAQAAVAASKKADEGKVKDILSEDTEAEINERMEEVEPFVTPEDIDIIRTTVIICLRKYM